MSTMTTVRPGSLFSYQMDDTAPTLLTEVLGFTSDGGVICAETLSTDRRRTSAVVDIEVFTDTDAYTYLGNVRPSSDRLPWIEDGDLFVFTYEAPDDSGTITGNTFVFEITHAFILGDPEHVVGQIHFPAAYYDGPGTHAYRFERTHLRDFQYVGKIDNGTRDDRIEASTEHTGADSVRSDASPGTLASPGTTA